MEATPEILNQFINHLKSEGLVIVSVKDLQAIASAPRNTVHDVRATLLRKKWLTFNEVLQLQLLKQKSRWGIQNLIDRGVIKPDETYKLKNNRRMVATSAIKRIAGI